MALKAHLDALETRHQSLKVSLSTEMKHASQDTAKILELKREKLKLKDEMSRLRRRTS